MLMNDLRRNLNSNLLRLDQLQRQLSTTRRINKPSDDPAGIVKSLRLRTALVENEQYKNNIGEAVSFMQTTDAACNDINEVLQKIRELTVKAATGTNDKDANQTIAREVAELNNQLMMIANTTYGSKYIFSGSNVTEPPYQDGTWKGNNNYLNNWRTVCGVWFACANIAVAACVKMLFLVNIIISFAMSTSRIRLSAACRFSAEMFKLLILCSNRFW